MGIITQKVSDKVGEVISVRLVGEKDQIMIITNNGQSIRMQVSDISTLGRNTQGVRLINLKGDEKVTGVALLAEDSDSEDDEKPKVVQ